MTTILIPRETLPGETRVAATPDTVRKLVREGFEVLVESGAGLGASIKDEEYEAYGARIRNKLAEMYDEAHLVCKLHPPRYNDTLKGHEADYVRRDGMLISFMWPMQNLDTLKILNARKVSVFAMDRIPRIAKAQSMDALSSQTNIAGYRAVIAAAEKLPKLFPMLMTAAGTIRPAKVVVMGAGVAGLQALATAKRLGAVVEVSDVRPAVKEQVESLGGRYIEVQNDPAMQDSGGYAKEASKEFLTRQQALVRTHITAADVVITTALVPGKPAPKLVTADMVAEMHPGSVIVDMAVAQGGNCELSDGEKTFTTGGGVTIIGSSHLAATAPFHASEMYARNVLNVINHLYKYAELILYFEEDITNAAVIAHAGKIRIQAAAEAVEKGGR